MDIASLFSHESLFPLHLKHPTTEAPLGIVFNLRSASSDEVKKIVRKHLDERTERSQRGKLVKGDTLIKHEVEKVAASIASWDWGGNSYKGEAPEYSLKKAAEILEAEDWIYAQVSEATNNLANFSTGSAKD
ncbi:hypothetical protein V5G24_20385 [Xanthobacter sp. VTT E-85241]|jgi:hypothetical protein|uniref:hypothetical protein n=1 Tax=Roseixanthobacter finlandensis TaxID=3119922 RepID=UPI00372656DD